MYLILFLFIFFFLIQFGLGLASIKTRANLKKKYSFILGEQHEVSKTLEDYLKDHSTLNLKLVSNIQEVCYSDNNLLILNKKYISAQDLYSNFYVIFHLKLCEPELASIRNINLYQNGVYVLQFVFVLLGFVFGSFAGLFWGIALFLLFLNFFVTFFGLFSYSQILKKVLREAERRLNLDRVERARVEALADEVKYEVFEYPLEIFWRIYQILK